MSVIARKTSLAAIAPDLSVDPTAPGPDGTESLTPDALMTFCAARLHTLDAAIQTSMAGQKDRNQAMQDCSALIQAMRSHGFANGHQGSTDTLKDATSGDAANHAAEANDLLAVYTTTKDPSVKAACEKAFTSVTGDDVKTFVNADGTAGKVTPQNIADSAAAGHIQEADATTWAGMIEDVKNVSQNMSNGAELDMIGLQSLVSQRQLAIQLTTQLMQSYNDGLKTVGGNIGRT